jgi:SAM-dependent methyltransferase
MVSRAETIEDSLSGMEQARKYAEGHKKYGRLMYGGFLKEVKALNISGSCLEMGAGPGFLTVMLAQQNPDIAITAVDLSPDMATLANEYIVENKLGTRIHYVVGDVSDEKLMLELGKFDFVYSAFSLHHWQAPESAVRNLWNAVEDTGLMYIFDFKRIGWLCSLPVKGRDIDELRAAYSPEKIKALFRGTGITDYRIKTPFPSIFQSIIARK